MLSDADKAWIKGNSAEVIAGSGETMVRKRLDTSQVPASFDADFQETVKPSEEQFLEFEFTGKVFFDYSEKQMRTEFGGKIEAAAIVHVPIAVDVVAGDVLVIREVEYRVSKIAPASLQGFWAVAVVR